MTRLPAPEGYGATFPEAVNGSGDVAGSVTSLGSARPDAIAVWPADTPDQPRLLTAPDGGGVQAVSIDDGGRVVGSTSDGSVGYVWEPDGTARRLPLPDGADSGQVEAARGNWVVGSVFVPISGDGRPPETGSPAPSHTPTLAPSHTPAPSPSHTPIPAARLSPRPDERDQQQYAVVPVRWDLRTDTSETFGAARYGGRAGAIAVTAEGDLVLGHRDPIVVRDGLPFALPGLAGGAGVSHPLVVTDDGTVFAGTILSKGARSAGVPVRWHC